MDSIFEISGSGESIHQIKNLIQQQVLLNAKLKRELSSLGFHHCDSLIRQLDAATEELLMFDRCPANVA